MKLHNTHLAALALTMVATQAGAIPFFVDTDGTGVGVAGTYDPTVCATCSSLKDQMDFSYDSQTTIALDGGTLVGDAITTIGGLGLGGFDAAGFADNRIGGFLPGGASAGLLSDASFLDIISGSWGLSFDFALSGEVSAATGSTVESVSYDSGLIEIYLVQDPTLFNGSGDLTFTNIFDMTVTGSDDSNDENFIVNGYVSFSGDEGPAFLDFFNMAGGPSCGGSGSSFNDLATCVPPIEVSWVLDQNLDDEEVTILNPTTGRLTGDHNGSLEFQVPEPTSLALLGAGLLGFGAFGRKKLAS